MDTSKKRTPSPLTGEAKATPSPLTGEAKATPSPLTGEAKATPSPLTGEAKATPSPLTGEGWDGGGNIASHASSHPHPSPPPSRGRESTNHQSPVTVVESPITGVGTNHQSPITGSSHEPRATNHEPRPFWYAVCCKPRQEAVAEENLVRQNFHVYLPRIRIRRHRRRQWVDAIEVLFPRYLFIRIDPLRCNIAPVRSTRGVVGLVRFGGQPAVVPDEVIDALLHCQDPASGLHQENRTPFSAGDRVKLVDGPFAGMEAVFAEQDGEKRVIVLLELLGKTNQVRVSRDWVAKAA